MYPNAEGIINQVKDIRKKHEDFSKFILEELKPPGGPYAIFHHHGLFLERLQNVSEIIERMGKARARVTLLNEQEERISPKRARKAGKPFPKYMQKILMEGHTLTSLLRLDNETLYIFGNLALDQWAYTTAYALGLDQPERYAYHHLITKLQAGSVDDKLAVFKQKHFKDAIWLYYQLRFYRNNFIEHVNRPWQRGSTMSSYGDDFKFFIPTPPGWIPESAQAAMFEGIEHLVPESIKRLPPGHWQTKPRATLEVMVANIDNIDTQADREKIWNVWKEIGGSTVSYDVLGRRLTKFIGESTGTVMEEMAVRPQEINLGRSPYIGA